MKKSYFSLLLGFLFLIYPFPIYAQAEEKPEYHEQTYLTEKQALDLIFKDLKVEKKQVTISPEQKKIIQKKLKRKIKETSVSYYVGKKNGADNMYAWILDEQGKHFPMTFIVGINKNIAVEEVAIMVYREKRGDNVKGKRFLKQFKNKTYNDPVEIDNDIVHVTGATISSWSVSAGVKKALIFTQELLKK